MVVDILENINIVCYNLNIYNCKRRYFVIGYAGSFWPTDFFPVLILYDELPDFYTSVFLLDFTVPEAHMFMSP